MFAFILNIPFVIFIYQHSMSAIAYGYITRINIVAIKHDAVAGERQGMRFPLVVGIRYELHPERLLLAVGRGDRFGFGNLPPSRRGAPGAGNGIGKKGVITFDTNAIEFCGGRLRLVVKVPVSGWSFGRRRIGNALKD